MLTVMAALAMVLRSSAVGLLEMLSINQSINQSIYYQLCTVRLTNVN